MARPTAPHLARHRPRLPGIGALPSPRHAEVGILPPRSGFRLRYFAEKPAPKVRQRCCPRSIADRVFFHHSHALPSILAWAQDCLTQSWRGHRIASLNPGVGTGLPHSILAWAQDCHTQSWCGHRIAPAFPRKRWKRSAVQHYAPRLAARIARKTPAVRRCTAMHSRTRRPDCPENYGSALLYSRTLPENSGYDRIQQQTVLGPRGATGSVHGHFPRAVKIGQNRGSDQPDSGAVSRRL